MSATPIRDWGHLAHQAAVKHLELCNEALYAEELDEQPEWPDTAGPYCGCDTCVIREVLHAAWPVIEQAMRSGDFDR